MLEIHVPFPDFRRCAFILDDMRRSKTLNDCAQVLRTCNLLREREAGRFKQLTIGFENEIAVARWSGHEKFLSSYLDHLYSMESSSKKIEHGPYFEIFKWAASQPYKEPRWWGTEAHLAYQYYLMIEDWGYYAPIFPEVMDDDVKRVELFGVDIHEPPNIGKLFRDEGMGAAVTKALHDQSMAQAKMEWQEQQKRLYEQMHEHDMREAQAGTPTATEIQHNMERQARALDEQRRMMEKHYRQSQNYVLPKGLLGKNPFENS